MAIRRSGGVRAGSARRVRATSQPSMPGMPMSTSATSGCSSRTRTSASAPSSATSTAWPSISSRSCKVLRMSGLSSTTRIFRRRGSSFAAGEAGVGTGAAVAAAGTAGGATAGPAAAGGPPRGPGWKRRAAGRRTMNSLPVPSPSLRAATVPPWSSTRRLTSVRPTPSPPWAMSSVRSDCTNRPNTCGSISGRIPRPLSFTRISTNSPIDTARKEIAPPTSVYLAALLSKFDTIWARRAGSTSSSSGSRGSARSSAWFFSWNCGWLVWTACWMIVATSTRSLRSSILPAVTRETSSRSSTRRTMCRTCRSIASRARCSLGVVVSISWKVFRPVMIGTSGFRSSCASIARNSSLRRSASASASARRCSSSTRRARSSAIADWSPTRWMTSISSSSRLARVRVPKPRVPISRPSAIIG
jgi:hypothetical protein